VRRALADLLALSPSEIPAFAQLTALAACCRAAVRAVPVDRLAAAAEALARHPALLAGRSMSKQRLAELTELVARVTGRRTRCLVRSLLLFALLRARGEEVSLVVGVARRGAGIEGHAWIEQGSEVVGETLPEGRFTRMLRLAGGGRG
jgi:hypothetical protein